MPKSKAMKDPGGYLRAEDVDKIVAAAGSERDRFLIKTLAVTGRRISEVVGPWGVRKTDIDPQESRIAFIILKKGGDQKDRNWKYVPKELVAELAMFSSNTPPTEPIFPISRQYAFKLVRNAARKAGVTTISGKPVHPHHFRHSFVARRMERQDLSIGDLVALQNYMEHSDIKVTDSYTHINPAREKKLFE